MKRTLALILALLLTLSLLAGCGGEKTPGTKEPEETVETTESTTEPSKPEDDDSVVVPETTEPSVPETSAPEDVPDAPVVQERPLTLGVVEGNTYVNTYTGYGCTLDANWAVMPADQLQELPDQVKNAVAGTEIGDAMQDIQQFTDMMAENTGEFMSMNVMLQKVSAEEKLMYMALSDEEILDVVLTQKDLMIEAYTAMGMNVSSLEKVTVTFLGEERYALKTVADMQGVACYMLQIFDYSRGEYSVTLTLSSYQEDKTDAMLELFYAVE